MVNIYLFLVDSFDNLPILVILVESFNKDGLFLPVLVVLVESFNNDGLFLPVLVVLVESFDYNV